MCKSLKLVKDESVDEESFGSVIRQVRSEARAVQHSNATYDLGDFRRISQSSKPVSRSSNWLQNWCPTARSQKNIQGHITQTRNQTTLVKLQHRHGSSELIRLLHDHGFIVSYDEVFRLKKSAAKFVGDSDDMSSILHQAMSWSRRVGPIFGWFDNLDLLQCINSKWTPRQPVTDPCHGSRVPAAPIRHHRNWK